MCRLLPGSVFHCYYLRDEQCRKDSKHNWLVCAPQQRRRHSGSLVHSHSHSSAGKGQFSSSASILRVRPLLVHMLTWLLSFQFAFFCFRFEAARARLAAPRLQALQAQSALFALMESISSGHLIWLASKEPLWHAITWRPEVAQLPASQLANGTLEMAMFCGDKTLAAGARAPVRASLAGPERATCWLPPLAARALPTKRAAGRFRTHSAQARRQ